MATKKAMRTRTDVHNDIDSTESASLRRSSRATKPAINDNLTKSPPMAAPKATMDMMPSELSAIFCNRGAGKRQPKLMSAVVLPSMIKLSGGDNDDEDDDFHVQEEELEVESESSDADDADDQTDKEETTSGKPKRGGGRSAATKHQLEESDGDDDDDDDDEQIQNGLGSDDGSSDDELTLDQTLDKFGKQKELTSVIENIGTTSVSQPLICAVCLLTEGELDEYIVQCDKCGISVHEMCYGDYPELDSASDTQSESSNGSDTEPWFCATCLAGLQEPPSCELCPTRGGIYKRTDCNKWIHVVCGLYIHQVSFGETERLENACLQAIPYQLWGAKQCMFCEDPRYARSGICVQCDAGRLCKTFFHPSCGQKMGFLAEPEASESPGAKKDQDVSGNEDGSSYIFFSFCKVHSDSDTVKSRQRAYKALQKQIANFTCCMTGKIERQLERQSANYLESRKNVDPWFPETPSQKLLSSRPELARTLTRRAEELGKIHKAIPLEYTVNVTNKWYMAPAFDVNFAAYFQDRERRIEELGKSIVADVKKNKALKEELEDLEKQLRKVTYVVDSMQLVVDKRVNQMIIATQHLRGITNFEYTLPVTCTSTLELLSKQQTSKKSNNANPNGAKSNLDSNDPTSSTKLGTSGAKEGAQSAEDDEIIIVLNMCEICKLRNNQHLVIECDSCKLHYHINCLDPPLSRVPKKGEKWLWQCKLCCPDTTKVQVFQDNLPRRRKKTVLFGVEEKENETSEPKEKAEEEVSEDKTDDKSIDAKSSEKSEPAPMAPPNVDSSPEVPLLKLVIPRAENVDVKWNKMVDNYPETDSKQAEEGKGKVATTSTAPSMFLSSADRSPHMALKPKLKAVVNPADVFDFDDSDHDNEAENKSKDQVIEKLASNQSIKEKPENVIQEQSLISVKQENVTTQKRVENIIESNNDQNQQFVEVKKITQPQDVSGSALGSTILTDPVVEKESQGDTEQTSAENSTSTSIVKNNDLNFNIDNEFCDETLTNSSENSTSTTTSSSTFETVLIERNPTAKQKSGDSGVLGTSRMNNQIQEPDQDTQSSSQVVKKNISFTEPRSQSSDEETVEFVGSDQKKIANEESIPRLQEKNSSYKPDFLDDLAVKSESPTNAGLNTLPKSSPLDLIDKWASESDHNATTPVDHFSFEDIVNSEQTEGSSTPILTTEIEQDSDHIDSDKSSLIKNKEALLIHDKATSSTTGADVGQKHQMKGSEKVKEITVPSEETIQPGSLSKEEYPLQKSCENRQNEFVVQPKATNSSTIEPSVDKVAMQNEKQEPQKKPQEEAVVQEEVQYREITKISPEGEPVVVRIPIRPKNRPQQQPSAPPFMPVKQHNSILSNETSNVGTVKSSQVNKSSTDSCSKIEKRPNARNEKNSLRTRSEKVKEPMLSGQDLKAMLKEENEKTTNDDFKRSKVEQTRHEEPSSPKEASSKSDNSPKPSKSSIVNGAIRSGFKPDFSRVVPLASENSAEGALSATGEQVVKASELPDKLMQKTEGNVTENDRKRKKKFKSDCDSNREKSGEPPKKAELAHVPSKLPKIDKPGFGSEKLNTESETVTDPNSDRMKLIPVKSKSSEIQNSGKESTSSKLVRKPEVPAVIREKVSSAPDTALQKSANLVQKSKIATDEKKGVESSSIFKVNSIPKSNTMPAKTKSIVDSDSKSEDKSPLAPFETPNANQKQSKSKIQLLDDLFNGPESAPATSMNTLPKQTAAAKMSEKKDKVPVDKEKNVKKIESISYAPRHKIESQTKQQNEQSKEKEVNSVETSEKNLHSKRPSVNHFKIPKNRKTDESKTTKFDIAKEYGARETKLSEPPFKKLALEKPLNEVQRRTLADDLEINKPKPTFPHNRDFNKSKVPDRSRPGTPTPSFDGLASPTSAFAPVPARNLPQTKEDTFKRKIGQLMEFTGSFSESKRTPHYHSGEDDDDEYDPTSNFKVEVLAPRTRNSDSFSSQPSEPPPPLHGSKLPVPPGIPPHNPLPVPLPPPTGYSFDDFDYDRPPTPPPGLFDPGKSAVPPPLLPIKKPSHNLKSNAPKDALPMAVPRTTGAIGSIPPPIKMVPPGRAAREGVKLTAVEPKVDKRPPAPSVSAPQHKEQSKHVVPTHSTPQAKRKKDFNQYLQENRAKAHKHQPTIIPTERVSIIPIDRIEEEAERGEQSKRRSPSPSEDVFSVESHQASDIQSDPKMSIETSSTHHDSLDKPSPDNPSISQIRSPIEQDEDQRTSRSGTPVMDESADPLIIRSTDPNDPASNFDPTTVPLSPNATMKLMQVLLDQNFLG